MKRVSASSLRRVVVFVGIASGCETRGTATSDAIAIF
jgi:hypothetical protein